MDLFISCLGLELCDPRGAHTCTAFPSLAMDPRSFFPLLTFSGLPRESFRTPVDKSSQFNCGLTLTVLESHG